MIEGIDYCFIYPEGEADITHIKLLDGPYKDTVFKYGKVKFTEERDGLHLHFAYDVIQSPIKKLMNNAKFNQYAGDLLMELMDGNSDQDIIDETGTDDSQESNL
jgi:hypothetical protein